MGYCTLIPKMCVPRTEIPLSSIKSPRRNSRFADVEISTGSEFELDYPKSVCCQQQQLSPYKYSIGSIRAAYDDRLHPKYSLGSHHMHLLENIIVNNGDAISSSTQSSFSSSPNSATYVEVIPSIV